MSKSKYDNMVIFGDGLGGFVSNDPQFNAEEYAEHVAGKGKKTESTETKSEETEKESSEPKGAYDEIKGKDLADLAKEREITLKREDGSKLTAGEVREALIAQDEAAKASDE